MIEPLSTCVHPSYLNTLPQRAASRASTITAFHPQQRKQNLSLSPFIVFLRLSLSVLFPVWPQVSAAVVFVAFFLSFPSCLPLALVTIQPLVPLTEVQGLAQVLAMSQMETSSHPIGWQDKGCPHIRAGGGRAPTKEGVNFKLFCYRSTHLR